MEPIFLVDSSALLSAMATNPDGSLCQSPCAFGIELGKTTPKDGIALIKSHPYTGKRFVVADSSQTPTTQHFNNTSGNFDANFDLEFDAYHDTIQTVSIGDLRFHLWPWVGESVPSQEMPTLGQLISSFGSPSSLSFSCGFVVAQRYEFVTFHYPEKKFDILILYDFDEVVKPEDRPFRIVLFADSPEKQSTDIAWYGFASIKYYVSQLGPQACAL